ncbi:MAG: Chorismate synthase [Phycisphaerae bacterium]|nr:Chorismate synthase [Phycisphaerae bacterium]
MAVLSFRTAGESHGPQMLALLEGLPAGLRLDQELINNELRRRQGGYGRSQRQQIERDEIQILSGWRQGVTMGSPLVLMVPNQDSRLEIAPPVTQPRPGHADFAGSIKWLTTDCRTTLERASARETAVRVAAGAVAKCLLRHFGISVVGYVEQIGSIRCTVESSRDLNQLRFERDDNEVYCPDARSAEAMIDQIRKAGAEGDTLGGVIEVRAQGVPPGLGSCVQWDERLDGRIMQAVGSIQAIKGVEIGGGFALAHQRGSQVHDVIEYDPQQRAATHLGFVRRTNNAGGLEGGMTNGQTLVVRAVMKPISTIRKGMKTVNLESLEESVSAYERSDVCAVPAVSVVAENVVAFEVARVFLAKFGGDTLGEVTQAYEWFMQQARNLGVKPDHS